MSSQGTYVRIRLDTETEHPPLSSFIQAIEHSFGILREIDHSIASRTKATIRWRITKLNIGSADLTLLAESILPDHDYGPLVAQLFGKGLEVIENQAVVPEHFSERALEHARALSELDKEEITRISVTVPGAKEIHISRQLASNIIELTAPKTEAIGSVEGRLETLTVHGRRRFFIYDRREGRKMTCFFSDDLLKEALASFGRISIASGVISYNQLLRPVSIRVKAIQLLQGDEQLPGAKDLAGKVNITSGREAAAHIRWLWGIEE